jgi:4-carboxymuconolactone decarboxylase
MDDFEKGQRIRASLFGAESVEKSLAPKDDLTQKFQRLITSSCFGQVWGDETVPLSDHSLITLSILGAQQRFTQFELHARLARKNGSTREQLIQVVQHLTVYCGVPTGGEAFRIIQSIVSAGEAEATQPSRN